MIVKLYGQKNNKITAMTQVSHIHNWTPDACDPMAHYHNYHISNPLFTEIDEVSQLSYPLTKNITYHSAWINLQYIEPNYRVRLKATIQQVK